MRRNVPPHTRVDELEQSFFDAMRRADLAALMACWVEDEEPVCVLPGGPFLVGLPAIRGAFERVFEHGGFDVQVQRGHVSVQGQCAVHNLHLRVAMRSNDGLREVTVLASHVYVRTAQGWRLQLHHTSAASSDAMDQPPAGSALLH